MINKTKILTILTTALMLGSCGTEAPFTGGDQLEGIGMFSKEALRLDVKTNEVISQKSPSRADQGKELDKNDFRIVFSNALTGEPVTVDTLRNLPSIVELEAGRYKISADYGQDLIAAFESPYFKGESDVFEIVPMAITTDIGTIKCNLQNVEASVVFDPILAQHLDESATVEIFVGNNSSSKLIFEKTQHIDKGVSGYFHLDNESTIMATFKGKVDGADVEESKSINGVEAGNHYRFTFKLHNHNGEAIGNISGDLSIVTDVEVVDKDGSVDIIPDKALGEDERPSDGSDNSEPDVPLPSTPPEIVALGNVVFDTPVNVNNSSEVELEIKSSTGFTEFIVDVESKTLDISTVGLPNPLDLINPGDALGGLQGLGLIPEDEESYAGKKYAKFSLTGFMPLLYPLFMGEHKFHITVGDDNGTVKKTLILNVTD